MSAGAGPEPVLGPGQVKYTPPPAGGDLPPSYTAAMAQAAGAGAGPPPPQPQYAPPPMGFVDPGAYPAQPPAGVAPPGAYPHPQHPQHTTIYAQPGVFVQAVGPGRAALPLNVILSPPVGNEPATLTCASCGQQVTTKVDYTTSWHTHLVAAIVCFTTMFFSMCCLGLIPYCCDACKNAEHYCPNCNAYIGKYEKC